MTTEHSTHTLGPWVHLDESCVIRAHAGGAAIACSLSADIGSITEANENARLIAAAPELLAALQALLEAAMSQIPPYEAGREAQNAWADRCAKARNDAIAIVAKATGAA